MAEFCADLLDDAFNLGGLAHVAAQHGNAVPELTCDGLQSDRILPDDYDGRTFLPEHHCSFKSDARSSAVTRKILFDSFVIFSGPKFPRWHGSLAAARYTPFGAR
jgi:hypothetical protein